MGFYDFNAVYDEYVRLFIDNNKGKYTRKQLENLQPKLFEKFKTQKIKNIGNVSVPQYYYSNKDKLFDFLKEYLKRDIEPDDFLIDAIKNYVETDELKSYLSPLFDGRFLNVIIDVLQMKGDIDYDVYIALLNDKKTPYETVNAIIDVLKPVADVVYGKLIGEDIADKRAVCEIICESKKRDDAISNYLKTEFLSHPERMVEYLDYIVRYGDDDLLGVLKTTISNPDLGYLEYKELKIAIEALGGQCLEKRDFSDDKNFKLLKGEDD